MITITSGRDEILQIVAQERNVCGCGKTLSTDDSDHKCLHTSLARYGWTVFDHTPPMIKFRKPGFDSEISVTMKNETEFEAEHIKHPDLIEGKDKSFIIYMTRSLNDLLRHIAYTARKS